MNACAAGPEVLTIQPRATVVASACYATTHQGRTSALCASMWACMLAMAASSCACMWSRSGRCQCRVARVPEESVSSVASLSQCFQCPTHVLYALPFPKSLGIVASTGAAQEIAAAIKACSEVTDPRASTDFAPAGCAPRRASPSRGCAPPPTSPAHAQGSSPP